MAVLFLFSILISNAEFSELTNFKKANTCPQYQGARPPKYSQMRTHRGYHHKISNMSLTEAQAAFDKIKNSGEIDFSFPDYGCQARAHKAAQIFDEMGIESTKVFGMGLFEINDQRFPNKKTSWGIHVANTLCVNIKGKNTLAVIDPSLFDKPVPVEEWVDRLTRDRKEKDDYSLMKLYQTSKFDYIDFGNNKGAGKLSKYSPKDQEDMERLLKKLRTKAQTGQTPNNEEEAAL